MADKPKELGTVIVHSDEALAVVYAPETHEVKSAELPDGNIMLHIRPIGEVFEEIAS